jgi:hypothetical protein
MVRALFVRFLDHMTTPLDRPIKRELEIDGTLYTVTISPDGVKVTEKGKRKGHELTWRDIISGDAALRRDLSLSLGAMTRGADEE